jgi:SAM-dependent methyltransferase
MIIRAGKNQWAADKLAQPALLAPISPSPDAVVRAGWEMLGGVRDYDTVFDLGCGDGRWVLHAAQQAECVCYGVDISESLLAKGRGEAARLECGHRVTLARHDLNDGLPDGIERATVIILYLFSEGIKMIGDALLAAGLSPGTKILSIAFRLDPANWTPKAQSKEGARTLYLYEL